MLTRQHIKALIAMPSIGLRESIMPYPAFALEADQNEMQNAFIEVSNQRFGHQMESLFIQIIEHMPNYELMIENLQIFDGKNTLGELDFIVKNQTTEKLIHIELAVKFYIYEPNDIELAGFVGPNHHDSLLDKINKLKERQFPLLHHKQVKNMLESLGITSESIEQLLCFKAFIFVPNDLELKPFAEINNACAAGTYIKQEAFTESDFGAYEFHFPPKTDWILTPNDSPNWLSFSQAQLLLQSFLEKKNAPMVWIKNHEGISRMFIVD